MFLIEWDKRYWTGAEWVYADDLDQVKVYQVYVSAAQDSMKLGKPCKPVSCMEVLLRLHDKDAFVKEIMKSLAEKDEEILELKKRIDYLTEVNVDLIKTGVSNSSEKEVILDD